MIRFRLLLLLLSIPAVSAQERLKLWYADHAPIGDGGFQSENAAITVHQPKKPNGTALVICPGGGYRTHVIEGEGHTIAKWLNESGITGIVLEYRFPNGRSFVPLLDAQRAIRTARFNSTKWGINPDRLGIIGFSAGGHVASSAGTHFDSGNAESADPIERLSCRPDFMILVYPVITMDIATHGGSRTNLLGAEPKPELVELFSNEKQITDETPPCFITHAADDKAVTPDNSRMFYRALVVRGVAAKYLELPSGGHGINGYQGPMWDMWQAQSLEWMTKIKMLPE